MLVNLLKFQQLSQQLQRTPGKRSHLSFTPWGELRVTEFGRHNGILMVKQYQWYMNGILMGYDIVND